jgi:hypothetical protein
MNRILEKLNLKDVNIGACSGPGAWHRDGSGKELVSSNPATGKPIATVVQARENI